MKVDPLLEKSLLAEEEDKMKKTLKEIRADLKAMGKYPPYMPRYVYSIVYLKMSVGTFCYNEGFTKSNLTNNIDSRLREYVQLQNDRWLLDQSAKMLKLVPKAIQSVEDILNDADSDATKLRAAELILKKYDVLSENSNVNLKFPVIKFTDSFIGQDLGTEAKNLVYPAEFEVEPDGK